MTVDEIESFYSTESISFDIFSIEDKVLIVRYPFNTQNLFNAVDSENMIITDLYKRSITTKKDRELPLYLCIVYRSVFRKMYKITTRLDITPPKNERGRTRYSLNILSAEPTTKYYDYIGKSFGKLTPPHGSCSPIFTYDKKESR